MEEQSDLLVGSYVTVSGEHLKHWSGIIRALPGSSDGGPNGIASIEVVDKGNGCHPEGTLADAEMTTLSSWRIGVVVPHAVQDQCSHGAMVYAALPETTPWNSGRYNDVTFCKLCGKLLEHKPAR